MDEILVASILQCRVAEAHVRLEAMRTANLVALATGKPPKYGESEILKVIEETGIHHNAVFTTIHEMRNS